MQINSSPLKEDQLSFDERSVRQTAENLIESVRNWKKGKCYKFSLNADNCTEDSKCKVQTYGQTIDGDYWLCRQSQHKISPENYRRFVQVLNGSKWDADAQKWVLVDRAARSKMEQQYIETLSKCRVEKLVPPVKEGEEEEEEQQQPPLDQTVPFGWVLVNLEYELGKPLATREFNEWVCPLLPAAVTAPGAGAGAGAGAALETSYVVSAVADHPIRDPVHHTHAYYASVEQLKYDHSSHVLVWTMCTTSDAGGNVPKWIQNATIARTVAKDVPYLINWLKWGSSNWKLAV